MLKPFWQYYGGKYRAAPMYPAPAHKIIVEPFAGAAGYSLRYPDHDVILIEKYHVIAEIWKWLITVKPDEVLSIPLVTSVDALPSWVCQAARDLVGFSMNAACTAPCKTLSSGKKWLIETGHSPNEGWSEKRRARVAEQVEKIRHWRVFEGSYDRIGLSEPATYFIDPPYQRAGIYYKHSSRDLDFTALGAWCRSRHGQVIVCENEGADWLPFVPIGEIRSSNMFKGSTGKSAEVAWVHND